ncbi:hypothetical protein NC652_033230 [Populus alba x Populus x berolinensis]|nr:hypothetical protein NC652_033230 [Populus alba x Populus x berolinensis]
MAAGSVQICYTSSSLSFSFRFISFWFCRGFRVVATAGGSFRANGDEEIGEDGC